MALKLTKNLNFEEEKKSSVSELHTHKPKLRTHYLHENAPYYITIISGHLNICHQRHAIFQRVKI